MTIFIQNFMLTTLAIILAYICSNWIAIIIVGIIFSFAIYWCTVKI